MKTTLFATTEKKISSPIGYDKILDNISNLITSNLFPNVNLICSPLGSGKRLLCEYVATTLLNASSSPYSNITSHPDLLVIDHNSGAAGKKEITIDETRKIQNFIHLTPSHANCQIIIIDSVDMLNKNSANNLLKTLEEPPINRYFLLICHNQDRVLDTIKSRCQKLHLPKLNKQSFYDIVNLNKPSEIDDSSLEVLYKIFPEQPGLAINFINSQGLIILEEVKKNIISNKFTEIKKFANQYDWKDLQVFNIFFTTITYIIYQNFMLCNQENNAYNITKLHNISADLHNKFSNTINLNLDRKNFVINTISLINPYISQYE